MLDATDGWMQTMIEMIVFPGDSAECGKIGFAWAWLKNLDRFVSNFLYPQRVL